MPSQSAASMDNFITINGNVLSAASSGFSPYLLVFTQNPILPTNTLMSFSSTSEVESYFGLTTNPNDHLGSFVDSSNASYYFSGSANKGYGVPPARLLFYYYPQSNTSAWTRGDAVSSTTGLQTLQSVTAGTLTLTFNGTTYNVTGINLSTAASLTAVATALQTKIQLVSGLATVTVTYDSTTSAFTITYPYDASKANTVNYITGTVAAGDYLAEFLNITQANGAVLSQGIAAQTPDQVFTSALNVTRNFITFTCNFDINSDVTYATVLGLIAANQAVNSGYSYLPIFYDTKGGLTSPVTSPMETAIINAGYGQMSTLPYTISANMKIIVTNPTNIRLAFSVAGMYASVNFNTRNGMLTGNAGTFTGVTPIITNDTDADLIINKFNVNSYFNLQTRANTFEWYQKGQIGGKYLWADTFIGYCWLNDACQVALANLMQSSNSIPYNNLSQIQAVFEPIFQQGLINGVVQNNITIDATIKTNLISQIGYDISSILYNTGYFIVPITASATDIVNRTLSSIKLIYTYGGGVVSTTINLTTVI